MKALFIGGTGTISAAIVRRLAKDPQWEVWLLNRGNRGGAVPEGVHQIVADIHDETAAAEAIGDLQFDTVCEFIAFHETDVQRDYRLFKGRTRQYIFISSASAYHKPAAGDVITEGTTLANPNRHDGALSPVVGVHNIQTLRANREHPSAASNDGWTYNHQPMLAWWQGRFYLHYLCDPVDEHVPPSRTVLQTSTDGYSWTAPVVLFPEVQVPDGFQKPGREEKARSLVAIM